MVPNLGVPVTMTQNARGSAQHCPSIADQTHLDQTRLQSDGTQTENHQPHSSHQTTSELWSFVQKHQGKSLSQDNNWRVRSRLDDLQPPLYMFAIAMGGNKGGGVYE